MSVENCSRSLLDAGGDFRKRRELQSDPSTRRISQKPQPLIEAGQRSSVDKIEGGAVPKQLIIAGFHRSGTSVVAQYLQQCGLFIGHELLGARPSNPYGHFEDMEAIRIHDLVLAANGRSWLVADSFVPFLDSQHWKFMRDFIAKRNSEHILWGFKDPRVCTFLHIWKYLVPDAKVLIIFRNPRECVASLHRRHANDLFAKNGNPQVHLRFFREADLALRMWNMHNAALVAFADAHPSDVLVLSQDTFADGFPLTRKLNELWDLGLEDLPVSAVYDERAIRTARVQTRVRREHVVHTTLETWRRLAKMESRTTGFQNLPTEGAVKESDFLPDQDITMIRMENELLRFENGFLKSKSAGRRPREGTDATQLSADLKYVLRKIGKFPFGMYFKRKKKFKAIFRRYGIGV